MLVKGASKVDHVQYKNLFADMVSPIRGPAFDEARAQAATISWQCYVQSVRVAAAEMELALCKAATGASSVRETFAAVKEAIAIYSAMKELTTPDVVNQKKVALQKVGTSGDMECQMLCGVG